MSLDSAYVEYPIGHGQMVSVPHQIFPTSFGQFANMSNPYRLDVAGVGFIDLPAGVDLWTPDGYVAIESMLGCFLEFSPRFTVWTLYNSVYHARTVSIANISRSKVLSVERLSGTQLSALPIYSGTFIELAPKTRNHVSIVIDSTLQQSSNGVPLGLTMVTDYSLIPDPDLIQTDSWSPVSPTMIPLVAPPAYDGQIISSDELLIIELDRALNLGSVSSILYDGLNNPVQVTGSYVGNVYVLTYTYGIRGGVSQIILKTMSYRNFVFTKEMFFDGSGLFYGNSAWIRQT